MKTLALVVPALVIALSACGGGDDDDDARSPTAPAAAATVTRSPAASPTARPAGTPDGATGAEVQGIVGTVDEAQGLITINVLQGADVELVEIATSTRMRDASGRTVRLSELRPSDRIIARGRLVGNALLATEVTVSQVTPGAAPGG